MPSKLFYNVRNSEAGKGLATTLIKAFERKPEPRTGTYLGRNQIQVQGQKYIFRNESGITINVGDSLPVKNVGRKAAAEYAPTSGYGTVLTSGGGGGGSSAATLADHDHLAGLGSGGVLTGYATNKATQIGQVLFSINGSTFSVQIPLIGDTGGGWLTNEDGLLQVVG